AGDSQWQLALAMLSEMELRSCPPDRISFNTVLGALDKSSQWEQAIKLFSSPLDATRHLDDIALGVLASACERGRALASAVRFAKSAALGFKSVRAPTGNYVATELHEESQLPSTTSFVHASVLLDEVVEAFVAAELGPGSLVVDCTLGGGGHSEALLQQLPQIRLLGIDRDPL
ncbi:unnamed protein product, partial [Polarella glacialis]